MVRCVFCPCLLNRFIDRFHGSWDIGYPDTQHKTSFLVSRIYQFSFIRQMSEILQKQEAQLTTGQLLQMMAEDRRRSDERFEAFLGRSVSYRSETPAEPESSVFLENSPIAILPGTQLPVETLGEVDSPISNFRRTSRWKPQVFQSWSRVSNPSVFKSPRSFFSKRSYLLK